MTGGVLAAVLLVILGAAIVQTTAGFGFSLMAVPLMALATQTRTASMIATVLSLLTSGFQAWHGRAETDWPAVRRLCLASAIGMPLGLLVFHVATERELRIFLGVSTLLMVGLLVRGLDLSGVGPWVDVVAGAVSGVLNVTLSTNGPPLVFVLQGRGLPPARFRPTLTTVFVVTGVVSLAARAALGGFTHAVVVGCIAAPVPLALGTFLGFRLRPHVDGPRFRLLVSGLLVVAAASALLGAL